MSVSDLTTAYTTLCLSLTRRERREVVVEQETLITACEHVVDELLIELRTQCTGRERHRLTTLEDRASVRHGQRRHLAPDGADLIELTAIHTTALIEDETTHGIAHHIGIIAGSLSMLLLEVVLGKIGVSGIVLLQEVGQDLIERILTLLLGKRLLVHLIYGLIKLVLHLLAQILVIDLVVILALLVCAQLLSQFILEHTHRLDSLVGSLQSTDQILLRHFVHLAFHHHDVVLGGTDHQIHVGVGHLVEGGVDDIFTIDTCHTHLRDGVFEGDGRASHGS